MTSMADRLNKAAKAGALQTLSEPTPKLDPMLPVLRRVRAYLSDPSRWIQNRLYGADDVQEELISKQLDDGYAVTNDCPACLMGASFLVTGNPSIPDIKFARALGFLWSFELTGWNDDPDRTHAEVLARLDESIARLEGQA